MINKNIVDEQKEINTQWEIKRSKGFFNYIRWGVLRCLLFLSGMVLIDAIIEKKLSVVNVAAGLIASVIIPLLSWIGNETRYKLKTKKKI